MNKDALFCDGTGSYVVPPEPQPNESVTLRFRTAKNDVEEVSLVTQDGVYPMKKSETKGDFDYYEIQKHLKEEPFIYCFQVVGKEDACYYDRCGVKDFLPVHLSVNPYAFKIVPGFSTPDWAKGAVMYQIFVDRFYNGDMKNDVVDNEYVYIDLPVEKVKDWNELPQSVDIRRFYGGDLEGVRQKLDYLQDLGVEVIYFNPIFVSPSNHKYDNQDYDYIDPHYGKIVEDGGRVLEKGDMDNTHATKYQQRVCDKRNLEASNQLFIELVEEMHKRGMRVIIDGVFNHCGSFHKWMDRERIYEGHEGYLPGAYVSADSPYRTFFSFADQRDEAWPYNKKYDGWWGHNTLPKLNYEESKELEDYIMQIGRKWVSPPYNVDGWRLDVAADLGHSSSFNHDFWKRFRKEVKEVNPDVLILAEHYGDPSEWLQGDEWDSVMNYDAFMEPVTWFLTGMEKHSDDYREDLLGNSDHFIGAMQHFMTCMLTPSLLVAMNELSNHDHSRFLTRTNHKVGRIATIGAKAASEDVNVAVMRLAVVMQMTWIGAPTLYYGDEAGVCGFTDPDNRRTYPWGKEDKKLLRFHKEIIRIHKQEKALRTGSILILGGRHNVITYARMLGDEQIVVAVNNSKSGKEINVPVWRAGLPKNGKMGRLLCTYEDGFNTIYDEYEIKDGNLLLKLGAHSAVVLKNVLPIDDVL